MTLEVDALIETYTVLKEYIPAKERQAAADALMSVMVDVLNDIDLKELVSVDSYLRRSHEEYANDGDGDGDEEYTDYED